MKSIKFSSLIFSAVALIAIGISAIFAVPVFSTNAESALGTNTISAKVLNENGKELTGSPMDAFNGSPVIRYNWQEAKTFKLSFNFQSATILPDDEGNFSYNIRIDYVNEYASDMTNFTDNTKIKSINYYNQNQQVKDLNDIETLELNVATLKESITEQIRSAIAVAENQESEKEQLNECYGWGVYRFSIVFKIESQNETASTAYIGLDPTALRGAPVISATEESSKTGIISAFNCFLTNENIEYLDQSTIKWYVTGKDNSGKTYVLTPEDLKNFEGFDDNIWDDAIKRNGTTFYFDSRTIAGTWEIYCEVTPHTSPNEAPATPIKSNVITVETGNKISSTTIIWWIVGGVSLLVVIVIIVIVVTKKKEKVW